MATNDVTNTQTITQNLPQWYQDYMKDVIGRAGSETSQPPPDFGFAPRVAGFTPAQQQAQQAVQNLQGSAKPYFQQGLDFTKQAAQGSSLDAASGYLGAATNQEGFKQGSDLLNQAGNTNIVGGLGQYLNPAQGYAQSGASTNLLGLSSPYIQQAVNPTGLQAAYPYLQGASQSLPQATMQNMSPFLGGAMNAVSNQAAYDLQNKYLPAVNDSFIRAGQFGSTRNQDITAQTIHDLSQSTQNTQAQMANQAYGQAGQLAEQNLGLQGQLGQIAGQLGTQQQQTLLGAGSTLGTLGGAQGGLQLQGAGTLGNLGSIYGQASLGQGQLQAQAALGLGTLANQQGQLGIGAANIAGNLSAADLSRQLQAGAQYGNQTNQIFNANMAGIGALSAVGQQQQALNQQNLNTMYQDQSGAYYFPQNQTNFDANILRGIPQNPAGTTQTTQTTVPTNTGAQVAGTIAGLGGLSGIKRGGPIRKRRYRRGGKVVYRKAA